VLDKFGDNIASKAPQISLHVPLVLGRHWSSIHNILYMRAQSTNHIEMMFNENLSSSPVSYFRYTESSTTRLLSDPRARRSWPLRNSAISLIIRTFFITARLARNNDSGPSQKPMNSSLKLTRPPKSITRNRLCPKICCIRMMRVVPSHRPNGYMPICCIAKLHHLQPADHFPLTDNATGQSYRDLKKTASR